MRRTIMLDLGRGTKAWKVVRRETAIVPDMRIPKVSPLPMPNTGQSLTLQIRWDRAPGDDDSSEFPDGGPREGMSDEPSELGFLRSFVQELKADMVKLTEDCEGKLRDANYAFDRLAAFHDWPDRMHQCLFASADGKLHCARRVNHGGPHLFPEPQDDIHAGEEP